MSVAQAEAETEPGHTDDTPSRTVPPVSEIEGMEKLIRRMDAAETIKDWSFILRDYISTDGNSKLGDNIAIFNLGPATYCPNIGTDHCQVKKNNCYAYKAENIYDNVLDFRMRQEFVWDSMDSETFVAAFEALVDRMQSSVDILRINEAGDLRHQSDLIRLERIAKRLDIPVYLYTASDWLDFSNIEHLVINGSNDNVDGHQRYRVVESVENVPESAFLCPASDGETDISCGDCLACMSPNGSDEIYEVLRA